MAQRSSLSQLDVAVRPDRAQRRRRRTSHVDDGAPLDLRVHPALPAPEPPPPAAPPAVTAPVEPIAAPAPVAPVTPIAPAPEMTAPAPAPPAPPAAAAPDAPVAPPVAEAPSAPPPGAAPGEAPAPAPPATAQGWSIEDDDHAAAAAFAHDLQAILDGTHPSVASAAAAPVDDGFLEHAADNARTRDEAEDERADDEPEPPSPEPPATAMSHDVFDRLTFANRFEAGTMSVDIERAFDAFDAEHDTALATGKRPPPPDIVVPAPAAMDVVEDLARIAPEPRSLGDENFDVGYDVQLVPQETGMSCWAAGAAMVVGWRDQVSINPSEIARAAGYWAQYAQGLEPEDTRLLEDVWGLRTEPGQSYSVEGFRRLLENYGPLWTAGAEPGPHIRVVAGLHGDGTPEGTKVVIVDPWERGMAAFRPDNRGSRYEETYAAYEAKQSELARSERALQGIYVAHAREPLSQSDPRRQR